MNITIIGGGNMARALLGGLIARGHGSDAVAQLLSRTRDARYRVIGPSLAPARDSNSSSR